MAAVPPAAPVFALMPAAANAHGLIDYDSREGIALFRSITRCLYTDTSQLYDGKPDGHLGFLNRVQQRIREGNMEALFNVPLVLAAVVPDNRAFIAHHGIFSLEHLRTFATPLLAANDRNTQDDFMMGTAIQASLDTTLLNRINVHRDLYTINGHISSILLLKVIIREAHLDSNASTRFARANLSNLATQMKKQGDDIVKFNEYVRQQLDVLAARGEETLDLLPNLIQGYKAVNDAAFLRYIEDIEVQYDDGRLQMTTEQLMFFCANRYKVRVEEGVWNAPNRDQARILALQSQVSQLQNNARGAPARGAAADGAPSAPARNGQPRAARREKYKPEPWMLVKPSDNDVANDVPKTDGGREYWWCVHHKRYCQHKTGDCKLGDAAGGGTPSEAAQATAPADGGNARALKMTNALVAISSGNNE
jgi:hypothetical protein